ncbi:TetR/AcrR family transcriptional regulator [Sphingobacterium griseoflavum]|uniref:TetR/AcrR family transcriptional regulator n=1 Tax=Sphingobacterium griseoflavum TaxID=1474952 RepID=UPI001673FFB2|nr:TetR family transcriptional regulator [Sphingobacterium griseoflavum]
MPDFSHDMELNNKQLEIIAIAKALFAQNGFDATSVRDIAQRAQINVAMINYYFDSKENLLEVLIKHGIEAYKLDARKYETASDPFLRLAKMVEHYVDSKFSDLHLYQILTNEANSKKRASYATLFTALRRHNIERLREVVVYGVEKGVFRFYDPVLLHTTMIGTFLNFKMNKSVMEEFIDIPKGMSFEDYLKIELTKHLKYILKAILTYEN